MTRVDFGTVTGNFEGNNRKPLYVFVMIFCYSRHMYVEFVEDQKVATFIRCHVNAFNFFGEVPGTIVPDNLKSAVIKASFTDSHMPPLPISIIGTVFRISLTFRPKDRFRT